MFKYAIILIFLLLPVYVHAAPTASDCDFNNNGKVDFADFVAFSQGYGTTQTQFDLNGDGAVTFGTLSFCPVLRTDNSAIYQRSRWHSSWDGKPLTLRCENPLASHSTSMNSAANPCFSTSGHMVWSLHC